MVFIIEEHVKKQNLTIKLIVVIILGNSFSVNNIDHIPFFSLFFL